MQIKKKYIIEPWMSENIKADMLSRIKTELFCALADQIGEGYYCIKFDAMENPSDYGCREICMIVDYARVKEKVVEIKTPEQMHLRPSKSFKDKLKCCARYLRDKTGGVFDD